MRTGLAALLVMASFGCSGSAPDDAGLPAVSAESEPELEVATALVRHGSIGASISAAATLEAKRESRIGPEVQGTLLHVFVDEGDRVEAGAPLFEVDPTPYRFALRQAEAGLDVTQAQRRQLEADLGRARSLRQRGIVAEQDIGKLETAVAVALAGERQAVEAVALARHRLGLTLVRAPYAASVAARLTDEGTTALVQPQTVVLVLQESGELEARAAIPESQLLRVRIGDVAHVRIEGLPDAIESTISAVGEAIDPTTRTYSVRVQVPNADHALKAGLFAHVELFPQARADALLVPRGAVRSEDGRTRIFTIRDGLATLSVTVGAFSEQEAELLDGAEADMVVIVGADAERVAPGMRVKAAAQAESGV
jgi:cobalt-zinc-cadmium efflux system membrane fusion protein